MDKKLLYKYFDCQTSKEEQQKVIEWVEESPSNKLQFEKERKFWILNCLREDLINNDQSIKSGPSYLSWLNPVLKIACILVIGIFIGKILFTNSIFIEETEMQSVSSPAGQQTEISLADGSKVWLNSHSSITYPASFNQKERKICLVGEAYFEVAKRENTPFIVQVGSYQVQVFGTSFNVLFRPEDKIFETSLFTGSVKVFDLLRKDLSVALTPMEKLTLENGKMVKNKIFDQTGPGWKNGLFTFDNMPFSLVIKELETYYSTQIKIENSILYQYKYTGKLRHKDGLEYILNVLGKDNPFTYNKDENGVYYLK